MNILRIVIAGIVWAAVATSCATTSSSSGSNSNWLEVCSGDTDCSSGLECWCGVCTKTCAAASDCSELAGATCDPGDATSVCGSPQTQAACLLRCKADGDCNVMGQEASCSNGFCKRSPRGDAAIGSCNDRGNAVQTRYHTILAAADNASNKACTVDADCVPAPAVPCSDHCGLPFLSKAGAASIATELANLDRELCEPFFATGCPEPIFNCPAIGFPRCVAGVCENSFEPLPDGGPRTCDDRTRQIGDRINALEGGHDRSCTKDADCSTYSIDMSCYHACESGPLSASGATAFSMELATLEAELCLAFDAAGCTAVIPPCVPPLPVRCVASQCEIGTMP